MRDASKRFWCAAATLSSRPRSGASSKLPAQEELARVLRVSRNTVNRWEMGERSPALPRIERIAVELGVGVEAVLPELARDDGGGPLLVPAHVITFDLRAIQGKPF